MPILQGLDSHAMLKVAILLYIEQHSRTQISLKNTHKRPQAERDVQRKF
jgi:hypothetical protein